MAISKFKSFSTTTDAASASGKIYDVDAIREDILNMVHTRKGEYPMDLNRGFLIHDYLFSPSLTATEENLIIEDARQQLSEDTRISITEIRVFSDEITHSIILYLDLMVKPLDEPLVLEINFEE